VIVPDDLKRQDGTAISLPAQTSSFNQSLLKPARASAAVKAGRHIGVISFLTFTQILPEF
jgi:hypothetical protein